MLLHLLHRLVLVGVACLVSPTGISAASAAEAGASNAIYSVGNSGARTVKVGLNKALVIDLPRDARDILVSNPTIADAVIRTPRRIYITGIEQGQANIIVFDRAGDQIVNLDLQVGNDTSNLSALINQLIPTADVNAEFMSGNILLTGTVKNALDARKAEDIADAFLGLKVPPGAGQTTTSGSTTYSGPGGGTVNSNFSGSSNLAAGAVPEARVISLLTIEGEDQVHLKVTVAEVQRNIVKQLGVNLNGAISIGPIAAGFRTSIPFGVAGKAPDSTAFGGAGNLDAGVTTMENGINAQIRALEQTGMIRTLAEPTLTAISGESASFLAGGEFPVPTGRDKDGNLTIEFKPFGVALAFTPVVMSEGRISLHVKTEVSELTSEGSITLGDLTIPGLKVRRAESTMELPSGGSIVLGGLMQDTVRQSVGAIPGLGKIPILGQLFRSRDFQRAETELVIIVTPYLVSPVARSALATPDQGFQPASDAQAILLGNINRVYGGQSDKPASYTSQAYKGHVGYIFE